MPDRPTLQAFLDVWSEGDGAVRRPVADTLLVLADACVTLAKRIARGGLDGPMGALVADRPGGDSQKVLDVWANDVLVDALRRAPVAIVGSEEVEAPVLLNDGAPLAVAMDPLDGSSNIDTNAPIGTLFAVLPTAGAASPQAALLQPGNRQVAAGYALYGSRLSLVITVGQGTHCFTWDADQQAFRRTRARVVIPPTSNEYSINASNYRFWSDSIQSYIDDCIAGAAGPRGENVNMRWVGSLVADCHRILARGGAYLYPRDSRPGYEQGRLRLVYEANPIAFLVEQAGGRAFDGWDRTLDKRPTALHERTPLMFGSAEELERIGKYKADPNRAFSRSPLFGRRTLFTR